MSLCVFVYVVCACKQPVSHCAPPPPHVVSFTVPNKTAPAGSNPFEDDDEEEEAEEEVEEAPAAEQRTAVNHISVKKEEMKTLVNRSETLRPPAASPTSDFSPSPWFQ